MIKQVLVNNHLENVTLADNTRRMILQREVEHEQMKQEDVETVEDGLLR
jgi:hypothetical protein